MDGADGLKYGLGVQAIAVAAALEVEGDHEAAHAARTFGAYLLTQTETEAPPTPEPARTQGKRAARIHQVPDLLLSLGRAR